MLASRTARQVEDWKARGLIDAPTARALLDDIGAAGAGRSFASVAVWLGITCLAFGAMTFVAANWDAMPRLLRMIALGSGMLVSYIAAGVLHRRGNIGGAEAFVLLGCGIFGAAVMLTGQMYHLTGPPQEGVLHWAIGTFAAAIATGAVGAMGLAMMLATLWTAMVMVLGDGDTSFHAGFVPLWAAITACVWWMRTRAVAHLCAIGALVWLGFSIAIVAERSGVFTSGFFALMATFAAVSLVILSARSVRALRGFEREATVYLLVFVFGMLALLYTMDIFVIDGFGMPGAVPTVIPLAALPLAALALAPAWIAAEKFDHVLAAVWIGVTVSAAYATARGVPYAVEAFALAISLWAIRMGGRQGWRAVTALGYVAFAVTVVVIYTAAAHGLLGTSLFYLGAGALLLIGALVIPFAVANRGRRP